MKWTRDMEDDLWVFHGIAPSDPAPEEPKEPPEETEDEES